MICSFTVRPEMYKNLHFGVVRNCLVTVLKVAREGGSLDESESDPILVYVGGINKSNSVGINKKTTLLINRHLFYSMQLNL